MQITKETVPASIPELVAYAPYLMYQVNMDGHPAAELSPARMQELQPTWPAESMVRGLKNLVSSMGRGGQLISVYQEVECADDPQKDDVHLMYLPAITSDPAKPVVFLCAGGAYQCVCSLVEALPVAAQLNELGYACFVLNYRCGCDPCLPKPLDDLAAAINLVQSNREEFGLSSDRYVVSGFSAGANVTALWGTEGVGWAKHGTASPEALFLMYPFVTFDTAEQAAGGRAFAKLMIGSHATDADIAAYDVAKLFTSAYPPCYIAHAEDDDTVPAENSVLLKGLLDESGTPAMLELVEKGGHGWGDGEGTDAAGWPMRAVAWLESL